MLPFKPVGDQSTNQYESAFQEEVAALCRGLEVISAVIRKQQRVSIELRKASTILSKLRFLTTVGLGPSVTHAGNTSFQICRAGKEAATMLGP